MEENADRSQQKTRRRQVQANVTLNSRGDRISTWLYFRNTVEVRSRRKSPNPALQAECGPQIRLMKSMPCSPTLALIGLFIVHSAASTLTSLEAMESAYTSLKTSDCRTVETPGNEDSYIGECKGVGGFKIVLMEGDLRQSIDIVTPSGKRLPLGFWHIFGAFSSVGDKAEWRLKAGRPVALIVRLNVSEDSEDSSRTTSYLLVSKISPTQACVVAKMKPEKDQNVQARNLADRSAALPCL